MEACAVGIFRLFLREVVLPVLVGGLSIGHMTFQPDPAFGEWHHPIVGQRQTHLRHGTGIDAQRLRTTAQLVVLQLHRELLGTHGQHAVQPAQFAVGLLHDDTAGIVEWHCHVNAVADAPMTNGVHLQGPLNGSPNVAIGTLQRAQTMLIGIEPQWSLAVGNGDLCFGLVLESLQGFQFFRA